MQQSLDIVKLIENSPIKNFNKEYQNKFIEKIKKNFNETQINLFVASFYSYLNYDQEKDYIIELNNIWKWLGFSRKDHCKVVLEKHFEKEKDYKIDLPQLRKRKNEGGYNKENIYMNIKTFKKLCLKVCTKTADDIHDYFIKLEEIFHEIINEESNELKEMLKIKDKKIIDNLKENEKLLIKHFDKKSILYLIQIEENLYKYGLSDDIKRRIKDHKKNIKNDIILIYCLESKNNILLEKTLKDYIIKEKYNISKIFNKHNFTELFEINDIEFIKDNIIEFENNLQDNKEIIAKLKKDIDILKDDLAKANNKNILLEKELINYKGYQNVRAENIKLFNEDKIDKFIEETFEYNLHSKVYLNVIYDKLDEYIEKNNILDIFNKNIEKKSIDEIHLKRIEILNCLTKKFEKSSFHESKPIYRCYVLNIVLKNCSSFYKDDVYQKFIDEHLIITKMKKIDNKEYKFNKTYVNDVLEEFNIFIKNNNFAELADPTRNSMIFRSELQQKICSLANVKKLLLRTNDEKNSYKTYYIGVILKKNN
jgi:hypothetical protein